MNKQLIEEICQLPVKYDTKYLAYNHRNGDWVSGYTYPILAKQLEVYYEKRVDPKGLQRTALLNKNLYEDDIDDQWASFMGQFFVFDIKCFPFTDPEKIISRSNFLREQARFAHRTRVEMLDKRTLYVYKDFDEITQVLLYNRLTLDYLNSCLQNDKQQLNENFFARYLSDNKHWEHFEDHYEALA